MRGIDLYAFTVESMSLTRLEVPHLTRVVYCFTYDANTKTPFDDTIDVLESVAVARHAENGKSFLTPIMGALCKSKP